MVLLDLLSASYLYIGDRIDNGKVENFKLTLRVQNSLRFTQQIVNSIIHWVFAIKYFKLAMFFPLIMGLVPDDEKERVEKRAIWTIRGLNILFYTFLAVLFVW